MSKSSQLGLPRAKENVYILHNLLRSGKKVKLAGEDRRMLYQEDVAIQGGKTSKSTEIEYVFVNPQFNRMFAKLVDGRTVDYDISFMDMCWRSYEEWESPAMKLEDKVLGIIQTEKEKNQRAYDAGAYSYQSLPHPQAFTVEELEIIAKLLGRENQ